MVITTSPLVKTHTLQEFWDLPEPAESLEAGADQGSALHDTPRAALWIDDDTYLEPDLMYISDELKARMEPAHWTRADIVVEVISPSNANYDRKTKSDTYQAMGIREMWLLDTERKEVEVRSFEAGKSMLFKIGDILHPEVLPKIEIPVSALFA